MRSRLVDAQELESGIERTLRLWRKTKTPADDDLRALWRHETRHVQRVMSYADARDVIVEAVEFVEDDDYFGVVLAHAGQSLADMMRTASPRFWMRRLGDASARTLLWRNVRRLAVALGVLHAQGLVHGHVAPDVIMTEGFEEPDFRLTGFEWSLWLGQEPTTGVASASNLPAPIYSFAGDWRALGTFIAWSLGVVLTPAGDVSTSAGKADSPRLTQSERQLLRRLAAPSPTESLDAPSITRAVDDLVTSFSRSAAAGVTPLLLLTFAKWEKAGDPIYEASDQEIAIDDVAAQIGWIQADLDAGATLLVPRDFDAERSSLRLVTTNMVYELVAFRDRQTAISTWDLAVCVNVRTREAALRVADEDEHVLTQPITVVLRFGELPAMRTRRGADIVPWSAFATPRRSPVRERAADVRRALLLAQTIEALVRTLENYPVEIVALTQAGHALIRAHDGSERDEFAKSIGLGTTADALRRLFGEDQRDAGAGWRLGRSPNLGVSMSRDAQADFIDVAEKDGAMAFEFKVDRDVEPGVTYFLRTVREPGTETVIRRRLSNLGALENQLDLGRALEDPWRERRKSPELLELEDDAFATLDESKQKALHAIFATLPSFLVVGPPGVGKTKLATEVIRRRLLTEPSSRILVSAQGHDALDHLQDELKKMIASAGLKEALVVRSRTRESRRRTDEDVDLVARSTLDALGDSELARTAPEDLRARIEGYRAAARRAVQSEPRLSRDEGSGHHAFVSLLLDAAHILLSTTNSPDVEQLVEAREQFDWVVIEEAARATGPELVGPLLLSGRRLLVGDHHQLAPIEADRVSRILEEPSLVENALSLAKRHVAPIFGDAPELDELVVFLADQAALKATSARARRLLEPFRSFVEEDEERSNASTTFRSITATLTEQRRMDPAIARVVSEAFYGGKLTTEKERAARAETGLLPYEVRAPMPRSPLVVIDFPHVSSTGKSEPLESHRPRWNNREEVESVIDVLCHVRCASSAGRPSLAVLSPYAAQVERLSRRIRQLSGGRLSHLHQFASVRSSGEFVGTVDSFQGSEADLVILSLVRNNPRAGLGALGFLRDHRRLNVALSRAKSQLVIVGSLNFLEEAVLGMRRSGAHDLSFITKFVTTLRALAREKREDGVPLATIVTPGTLRGRS
jgi:hypothetical protein